jgi:hypothetical protein
MNFQILGVILKREFIIKNEKLSPFAPFYFNENIRPYILACNR